MNPGLKIGEIAEKLPLVEVAKVVVRLVTTAGGNQRRKMGRRYYLKGRGPTTLGRGPDHRNLGGRVAVADRFVRTCPTARHHSVTTRGWDRRF